MVRMLDRLNARAEWKFVGVLLHADRSLAIAWWAALALRVLAALFAIAMGALVGAVQRGDSVATPRIYVGAIRCGFKYRHRSTMQSARTLAAGLRLGPTIAG
jgi:hypothetical protein